MSASATSPTDLDSVDAFAQRVLDSVLGSMDTLAILLGDRLGWYRSLAEDGPAAADELAARTGTHPRYTREWLEQQAVTGLLGVEDGDPPRFVLSPAGREVLTDPHSLSYLAPLARMICGATMQLPGLLEAYRDGGGVSWSRFGRDVRESQADANRPLFEKSLPGALRSIPEIDRMLGEPGARIADIGCGGGWSTITLARTYPGSHVHGVDIDPPSVALARSNLATESRTDDDVAQRVTFTRCDASELPAGHFRAAFAFECLHDMPRPVEVLAAVRRSLTPGGFMIVMDEAVAETFTAPGDDLERLMYGYSLTVCLPDGMSHTPSAATGTVMRPATLRRYALDAGFTAVDVLPIEDVGFFRFYLLRTG